MKKIQISSVKRECQVEVIDLNSYIISKIVRAQVSLESALGKKEKTEWNEATQKREKVLDEKGNQVYTYNSVPGELLAERVLPLLNELVEAFEAE